VPTSAAKAHRHADEPKHSAKGEADGDDAQDFTTCMFCQVHDKTWNENDLDVHYWKDCPLLISCPSCAQIVEIAGLPEHLLDECDEKDQYVPCDVTGKKTYLRILDMNLVKASLPKWLWDFVHFGSSLFSLSYGQPCSLC
jgi:centrosomal protein CEP104